MTLPPHVLAQCQRILDGAAQRILDEQIEAEAAEADRKARDTSGMAGWWYVRDAQQMRKNEPDVAFSKFHLRGEWFEGDPILLRFVADMDEKENWA
jgi:hypothetical protein